MMGVGPQVPFKELDLSKEVIGKGSFGEVYKAEWHGCPVAVKIISQTLPSTFANGTSLLVAGMEQVGLQLADHVMSHT